MKQSMDQAVDRASFHQPIHNKEPDDTERCRLEAPSGGPKLPCYINLPSCRTLGDFYRGASSYISDDRRGNNKDDTSDEFDRAVDTLE